VVVVSMVMVRVTLEAAVLQILVQVGGVQAGSRIVVVLTMPHNTLALRCSMRPVRFVVFSHVGNPASDNSTPMYRLA
jgi:hypothetical protein